MFLLSKLLFEGVVLKRGARLFYLMGTLVLILTVWTGLEVQWSKLDDITASSVLLNLIIGISVGLTEIAVGWLIGLHIDEPKK